MSSPFLSNPHSGAPLKILTVVSQALHAEETVRVREGRVDLSANKLGLDAMDEYGVEQALRFRDGGVRVEIVAICVGPEGAHNAVRAALDMGVDRGIHVLAPEGLDVPAIGSIIASAASEEKADLVFAGGQQASWDTQALGGVIAETLNWPLVTWVNALEFGDGVLLGRHDVDGGSEEFELALPAVVTTQQGLNEPRYPTVPNIRKSKGKELRQEAIDRFGAVVRVRSISASLTTTERRHEIVDGKDPAIAAARIVEFLRDEAKVIG